MTEQPRLDNHLKSHCPDTQVEKFQHLNSIMDRKFSAVDCSHLAIAPTNRCKINKDDTKFKTIICIQL